MTCSYMIAAGVLAINPAMFAVMGIDKRRAARGGRRFRESLMLLGGLLGGAGGVLSAMVFFRHKTQKKIFRIGMPILFFLNLLGMCILFASSF